MIIDCASCVMAGPACQDCLVSVLIGPREGEIPEVCDEHADAVRALAETGLVPPLRLVSRVEPVVLRSGDMDMTGS